MVNNFFAENRKCFLAFILLSLNYCSILDGISEDSPKPAEFSRYRLLPPQESPEVYLAITMIFMFVLMSLICYVVYVKQEKQRKKKEFDFHYVSARSLEPLTNYRDEELRF